MIEAIAEYTKSSAKELLTSKLERFRMDCHRIVT
jgi:hypothetical protein